MNKFYVENKLNFEKEKIFELTGEQFKHLSKVLRLGVGEEIMLICGDEFEYICEITNITNLSAEVILKSKQVCKKNPKFAITLFQGLPKGEKTELIIQKVSELGVSELILFESDFTIAKLKKEQKLDRYKKIASEACKQCGRSIPMNISEPIKLAAIDKSFEKNSYDLILFLNETAEKENHISNLIQEIKNANNIALVIGSEGGFSQKEIEMLVSLKNKFNIQNVSLGERILRTETAAIAISGFVSFIKNN